MKDIGLLFTDEMVRAYLAGRKTQTRRPATVDKFGDLRLLGGYWVKAEHGITGVQASRLPYQPGANLCVRECFTQGVNDNGLGVVVYRADGAVRQLLCEDNGEGDPCGIGGPDNVSIQGLWRPNIHMPRWAARLVLPIVSVRVERVLDITEDDARAEGVGEGYVPCPHPTYPDIRTTRCVGHRPMFLRIWGELYGAKHPPETAWCWVIETEPYKGATR